MSVAPHSGIVDFGTFTSPTLSKDGIQGEVPAPTVAESGFVLSTDGWVPAGGGGGSVTQIIAGTNVTISPTSGLGAVTINATGGSGAVTSVNGYTGVVVLTAADVGALTSAAIGVTVQGYNAYTVIDSSYVHTDNNYTTAEKSKLAGIQAGAQVNTVTSVNTQTGAVSLTASDVGALATSAIGVTVQGYNANTVIDASYVHTDNNYTTAEKTKLAGIQDGAEVNVNADWNATSGDAQILNKPTLGTAAAQNTSYFFLATDVIPLTNGGTGGTTRTTAINGLRIFVQTTAPSSPQEGDIWFDTSGL